MREQTDKQTDTVVSKSLHTAVICNCTPFQLQINLYSEKTSNQYRLTISTSNRFDVSTITDKSRVITERTSNLSECEARRTNLVLSVMTSDLSVIVRDGESITS